MSDFSDTGDRQGEQQVEELDLAGVLTQFEAQKRRHENLVAQKEADIRDAQQRIDTLSGTIRLARASIAGSNHEVDEWADRLSGAALQAFYDTDRTSEEAYQLLALVHTRDPETASSLGKRAHEVAKFMKEHEGEPVLLFNRGLGGDFCQVLSCRVRQAEVADSESSGTIGFSYKGSQLDARYRDDFSQRSINEEAIASENARINFDMVTERVAIDAETVVGWLEAGMHSPALLGSNLLIVGTEAVTQLFSSLYQSDVEFDIDFNGNLLFLIIAQLEGYGLDAKSLVNEAVYEGWRTAHINLLREHLQDVLFRNLTQSNVSAVYLRAASRVFATPAAAAGVRGICMEILKAKIKSGHALREVALALASVPTILAEDFGFTRAEDIQPLADLEGLFT